MPVGFHYIPQRKCIFCVSLHSEFLNLSSSASNTHWRRQPHILHREVPRCFSFTMAQQPPPPPSVPGTPYYQGFMIILRHTTLGRTPLDEWSAQRRDLYPKTHNIHDRHPRPRRASNPQSQQASGHRLTPLGPASPLFSSPNIHIPNFHLNKLTVNGSSLLVTLTNIVLLPVLGKSTDTLWKRYCYAHHREQKSTACRLYDS